MTTKRVLAKPAATIKVKSVTYWQVFFNQHARTWMASILVASDVLSVFVAILAAMQIRRLPQLITNPAYHQIIILLVIVLIFTFARRGLYPGIGMNYVDELQNIVSSTSFAFIFIIGVTFMLQTSLIYSRLTLFLSWLMSLMFIPAGRHLIRLLLITINLWGEPVIIFGDLQNTHKIAQYFKENLQFGIRPMAVYHDRYITSTHNERNNEQMLPLYKNHGANLPLKTVLVVVNDLDGLDTVVDRYRFVFQRVILVKSKNGKFGLNSLAALDFSNVLGLQVKNNLLSFSSQFIKRTIDIVASFLGLLFLIPLFSAIALSIKIVSPGRIFYRQKRLGRDGKVFTLLKFRTMHLNADRVLKAEFKRNPKLKTEWERFQKLKNDPRITRVGKYLRKFSLDELPQLWNVLRGEMSLVGPRPIMVNQRDMYGRKIKEYVQVRPGITGLWQVSGRNQTSFTRRAELDDEYIQRWSIWLDLYILIRTIEVVFMRRGAY